MAQTVLTDSGFWLGLLYPGDQYHSVANDIADIIDGHQIILPWPCLYEIISTRLVRQRKRVLRLEEFIKKTSTAGYSFSLTDCIIREILKDINIKINYLVTFNKKDFEDICQRRRTEIVSDNQ